MRIERVIARAFGPFRGETLELAPGMTVVVGPNEAGKSTWHAALRLAITGIRRGRGRATAADAAVEARHRPWDQPEQWEVEARLHLDDGRTIDISQDLAGKVACRAWDVALGRDVSDEILDGTPDASRWLGLDRDSFASTVSVNQAQILAVADAADQLQDHMQRAAATRGTDATAAEAIDRLEEFRRQAVGVDRIGAKGPLRAAKAGLAAAEAGLAEARRLHEAYLAQGEAAETAERAAADIRRRLAISEAALARHGAEEAARRAGDASELAARHPAPPPTLVARDGAADMVAAAVEAWAGRPPAVALTGPSAEELRERLAALPSTPEGDLVPHPSVVAALRELDLAGESLRAVGDQPSQPERRSVDLDEPRLRELARRLRGHELPVPARLEAELADARRVVDAAASPPRRLAASGAIALAIGGLLALVVGAPLPVALLLFMAAAALVGWTWAAGYGRRRAGRRFELASAALAPYRQAAEAAAADRYRASTEAEAAGLPSDPDSLDGLADSLRLAARDREQAELWMKRRAIAEERCRSAQAALRSALAARGETNDGDIRDATAAYEAACADRGRQANEATRRDLIAGELLARETAERAATVASQARGEAERRLREAAAAVSLDAEPDAEAVAQALVEWQGRRAVEVRASQAAIAEWERLKALLDGRSIDELCAEAAELEGRAAVLLSQLDPDARADAQSEAPVDGELGRLRDELSSLEREAASLIGSLATRGEGMPDVAEAEERLAAARIELERVESLARTIDETLRLLRAAEERIHRSLAPILAEAIGRWLPIISDGDYAEVSVDPADLSVRVKEARSGQWRRATLLSEGTREQIYLLLRVAMAQHLVSTGETAPLILDEVTAQADAERRQRLLAVLHQLSRERQVVLFTHDVEVEAWANRTLEAPRDAIVRLGAKVSTMAVPELDRVAVGR